MPRMCSPRGPAQQAFGNRYEALQALDRCEDLVLDV